MTIVKVGDDKYINVDRMTYVAPGRKGKLVIHFDVGGGEYGGTSCCITLEQSEADLFKRWLETQNRDSRC